MFTGEVFYPKWYLGLLEGEDLMEILGTVTKFWGITGFDFNDS